MLLLRLLNEKSKTYSTVENDSVLIALDQIQDPGNMGLLSELLFGSVYKVYYLEKVALIFGILK